LLQLLAKRWIRAASIPDSPITPPTVTTTLRRGTPEVGGLQPALANADDSSRSSAPVLRRSQPTPGQPPREMTTPLAHRGAPLSSGQQLFEGGTLEVSHCRGFLLSGRRSESVSPSITLACLPIRCPVKARDDASGGGSALSQPSSAPASPGGGVRRARLSTEHDPAQLTRAAPSTRVLRPACSASSLMRAMRVALRTARKPAHPGDHRPRLRVFGTRGWRVGA